MKLLRAADDDARAHVFKELLARKPGHDVIRLDLGTAVADAVASHRPDQILLGLARPDRRVLRAVREIATCDPQAVVLFVDDDDPAFMAEAIVADVSS